MNNLDNLSDQELEQRRDTLATQIEQLRGEFIAAGQEIEQRRRLAEVIAKRAKLQAELAALEDIDG